MAQDPSLPTPADVVAVSGGHPGNPWREQRLLFLYQGAQGHDAEPVRQAEPQSLPAAA